MAKKSKPITALKLPKSEMPLDERQQKYLAIAEEKIGFVPNEHLFAFYVVVMAKIMYFRLVIQ